MSRRGPGPGWDYYVTNVLICVGVAVFAFACALIALTLLGH